MQISVHIMIGGTALVLAACTSASLVGGTVPLEVSTTAVVDQGGIATSVQELVPSTAANATVPASETDDISGADKNAPSASDAVVSFVAVLDDLFEGTEYREALAEDPEIFVATGLLFCNRLDGGATPSQVLNEYVETLTGVGIADADVGVLDLAGWIMGVAVGQLCLEHTDLVTFGP